MDFQTILLEVRNQIAFVTFNRPDSMNAVNRQMARDLVDVCRQIEEDAGIRVAIFTGAGEKAFSAGMDLKERSETSFSPIERRQQKLSATIQTQTRAVAAVTKPTIAAIRGYCVGGGLEFALACDMRVAAEDAKLGLAEVKRGLIPGSGGTQRLPRTVGVAKALEICLTGDNVTGAEAQRLGLVNIAVLASDVMKAAEDLAVRILKGAPMSVLFIKEAIKKGVELSLDEGFRLESDLSAMIATTEDSKEGPRAFAEKRAPVWKGK
ncbi:MAG: enoyl-CoA hydratase/isomerase family protein [Deltaproteobacteria bacterium]|nr:enoyl-CoA hydratase/isomerase family protein [Deltaproteobacteria bacterium]MDZ4343499.1 enoyl-CoA hydratase/isomerase family protein [Candidatus Binatia bacterium]